MRWDGRTDPPDLLLTAHTDTIDPVWDWRDVATVDGTVVTGLGAQDDKGCGVAILLGAVLAREAGVDLSETSVALGFVVDEEVGGKGSRALADSLRPRFVVASEGSELDIATVETGFLDGWVRVSGVTMHGSLPEEADNAVEKAARLLLALHEAPFTSISHPIAGPNTVTAQRIESSSAMNAIPDVANMYISCRVFGEPSLDETRKEIEAICRRFGATFELHDHGGWWETPAGCPAGPGADPRERAGDRAHARIHADARLDRRPQLLRPMRIGGRGLRPRTSPRRTPTRRTPRCP